MGVVMASPTVARAAPPRVWRTSIGKKVLMAASGVILVGFVIAHELGNLKVYRGAAEINRYAAGLRTLAEPIFPRTWFLWGIRLILIAAFVVHIVTGIQLARQSRAARVQRYAHPDRVQADVAASTMRWGGLAIALFLVFHLSMFTWGWVHPGYTYIRGDVYHNLVGGFGVWWISGIYIVAMIALGLHIYHGAWSIFQTFGVNNRLWDRRIRMGATAVALFVVVGNCSIPIAVLAGGVK
jgi:succinate dehydrogenase / fumarate reductase cytochrome b subunit